MTHKFNYLTTRSTPKETGTKSRAVEGTKPITSLLEWPTMCNVSSRLKSWSRRCAAII